MADTKKKKFKLKLEYDLSDLKEPDLKKDSQAALKNIKGLKPLVGDVDAELDARKWNERKLKEEGYYGFRMAVILLDKDVKKAGSDEKKLKGAWDDFLKDASYGLDKWIEEQASGKADNAAALKKGKEAMNKLKAIQFKGAFEQPRTKTIEVLEPLTKDGAGKSEAKQAATKIAKYKSNFEAVGKEAQNAVDFLLKTAKTQSKDDAIDGELKQFYEDVLELEGDLQPFNDGCTKFAKALDDAASAVQADPIDSNAIKEIVDQLKSLSSLDRDAQTAVKTVNDELLKKFKKIEGKLK